MANLFYVIGASGAGKDSLLSYARRRIGGDAPVIFCHRYITRAAHAGGENHIELPDAEFENRLQRGCFAMHWQSHGHRYAVGQEIHVWLQHGLNVVVNGSRAYLKQAAEIFPDLIPVHVVVSDAVLFDRLSARGRESSDEIRKRIERSHALDAVEHPNMVELDNNQPLELSGEAFIRLIHPAEGLSESKSDELSEAVGGSE